MTNYLNTSYHEILIAPQNVRRKASTPGDPLHALAAERHDVRPRGQQNQPRWIGEFREDAHDGTNDANRSVLSIQAPW